MKKFELKNKIPVAFEQIKNAQQTALCLNFSISGAEKLSKAYGLMSRLFSQGIKFDKEKIELSCKKERDFLSLNLVCLTEDLPQALEVLSEAIKKSPFENLTQEEFDMAKDNIREEIIEELNSPKAEVFDNYFKTLFEGHFYAATKSKILETLDEIKKEELENAYRELLFTSKKVIAVVADFDSEEIESLLNKYLGDIENNVFQVGSAVVPPLKESKIVEIIKPDIEKSQVVMGLVFPPGRVEDSPNLSVLNVILGHDGLCSRLFFELREKQDLVYAIRSSYDVYKQCAVFSIYISTDSENIQAAIDGAKQVIYRLKQAGADEVELNYAKKILISKAKKIEENSSELASRLAYFESIGHGFDFQEEFIEKVKKVTPEQIQFCANEYFTDKLVVSVLRSEIN